jgi:hypothetical protein
VRVQDWKSVLISLHEALLQGVCKDDMLYQLKWAMMLSCRHRGVDHRDSTFALGAYFLHICFILPAAGLDFSLVGENYFFARALDGCGLAFVVLYALGRAGCGGSLVSWGWGLGDGLLQSVLLCE